MEKIVDEALELNEHQLQLFIKGIILGIGMTLPGISGGTILLLFGMHERILSGIFKIPIKSYISLGTGTLIGGFTGVYLLSYLFEFHKSATSSFILGCIVMSIPFILKRSTGFSKRNNLILVIGVILAYIIMYMPTLKNVGSITIGQTFIAGFISSIAMMIPGISGSSILVVLGIYEEILLVVRELRFVSISVFVIGAGFGLITISQVLKTLFAKFQSEILFFFSGLILGSSKILFPEQLSIISIITFIAGVGIVYKCGNYR
ncbi:DUF368 domain-containing protein [Serpentinicella alkaliphila]|uniref:Putative membrane protein n=1 Tax=Serpentinicella alkaliphila TaxID=1734049 RepID=A0A4R2TJD0_9FIRM|nr:DUF368 domain-containing protein [Serpentinicella alkaliphila]QUH25029.1 DUF368 domain-containing protein [Serpentinicella alkaliphila]TCQ02487.1 putative membrane protein [Serpentinicella alkaliphila]